MFGVWDARKGGECEAAEMCELYGSPKAIPHLLQFLRSTEVGYQEGEARRQRVWGERRDREGEKKYLPNRPRFPLALDK